jgi:hypothetical protein
MPKAKLALLVGVNGANSHLDHAKSPHRELPQEIVRVAEARPEIVKIEPLARRATEGRIAALAVRDCEARRPGALHA